MSVGDRISLLVWKSEADTIPVAPRMESPRRVPVKPEAEPKPIEPDTQDSIGEETTEPPVG